MIETADIEEGKKTSSLRFVGIGNHVTWGSAEGLNWTTTSSPDVKLPETKNPPCKGARYKGLAHRRKRNKMRLKSVKRNRCVR